MLHFENDRIDMVVSANHDVVLFLEVEIINSAGVDIDYIKVKAKNLMALLNNKPENHFYSMVNGKSFDGLEEVYATLLCLDDLKVYPYIEETMYCFTVPTGMFVAKREKEPL